MTIAYFDCFNGAGGDMIVGALVDAGADGNELTEKLAGLGVGGYSLSIEKINKQGLAATRFHVQLDPAQKQPHRHLKHVLAVIEAAKLPASVKEKASAIFTRLAQAEAEVHGTTIEKVHFHEVGAVDAIIDVVGAVLALEMLGVTRVECSRVAVGSGTITCSHGVMPVPAPATALLLQGVPIEAGVEAGELTTPTGAAVLRSLSDSFGPIPSMTTYATGHGAGSREGKYAPNVLRVMIGHPLDPDAVKQDADGTDTDTVTVLETNLDDATPQIIGYCMERLLEAGALDVFSVPIQMKKNRPGVMLCVMCEQGTEPAMEAILFAETPTLGIRQKWMMRAKLRRRQETVETPFGPIRVKVGEREGGLTATPEYEDCRVAAKRNNVPLQTVMEAARAAFGARLGGA
jgi:uncharacterized protein (TIGR00299 family) protein